MGDLYFCWLQNTECKKLSCVKVRVLSRDNYSYKGEEYFAGYNSLCLDSGVLAKGMYATTSHTSTYNLHNTPL